jgi:hypothetical protein
MSVRVPANTYRFTSASLPVWARAMNTRPTGFAFEPPSGPAMPVMEMATSAPQAASEPSAMADATMSLTAPLSAIASRGTPSSVTLDSSE